VRRHLVKRRLPAAGALGGVERANCRLQTKLLHCPTARETPMSGLRLLALIFLACTTLALGAHAQDANAGVKVFQTYCSICHTVQPDRNLVGPSLFGVVNRPSGHIPGFHYSEANRKSGITWDVATLDRYLTAPRQVVPGTLMTFPGVKDTKQRADLIAYLATLH
jgi:cytochrome c